MQEESKKKLASNCLEISMLILQEHYEDAQHLTQNMLFMLQEQTGKNLIKKP